MQALFDKLNENQRKGLFVLSSFQDSFYYDFRGIKDYLLSMKRIYDFGNDSGQDFYPLIKFGIANGIFQKIEGNLAYVKCHPLSRFYIKKSFKNTIDLLYQKDQFQKYYRLIANDLYAKIKSKEPQDYQDALEIMQHESSNLLEATLNALKEADDFALFTLVLNVYFKHNHKLEFWLSFHFLIKREIDMKSQKTSMVQKISLLDSMGNIFLDLRRSREAEKVYLEAVQISNQIDKNSKQLERLKSVLFTNLGNCATNQIDRIEWQEKAYKITTKNVESQQGNLIAYNLSEAYFEINNHEKSLHYLKIAMDSFLESGNLFHQIKAHQSFSSHYQISKNYEKSEESLQLALTLTQTLSEKFQEGVILQELAGVYFLQSDLEKAISYCKDAIELFITAGDTSQLANAYNLLSAIAFSEDDLSDGIAYAEKALVLFHQDDNFSQMAQTYTNIALKCYKLQWYKECITELDKAIQLYDKIDDRFHVEKCNILLASASIGYKKYDKGKSILLKTLKYFVSVKNKEEVQHCLNLAAFLLKQSQDDKFELRIKELVKSFQF